MSENEIIENQRDSDPVPQGEQAKQEQDKELKRGQMLIRMFASLLVFLGFIYVILHYTNPGGLLSPKMAIDVVTQAIEVLKSHNLDSDSLSEEEIQGLNRMSVRLRLLQPQFDAEANYMTTIGNIDVELGKNEKASWKVLQGFLENLESIIRNGSGNYFWTGSIDRWIELCMWAFFGNLIFLLNEIKNEMETYYPQITKNHKIEGFIKPTPWYIVYFFRGPFIAMVILVAVSSLKLDVVGISLNLKESAIEVSIVMAAILGYYSRVAAAQLEIITKNLLGNAWEKVYPKDKEIKDPKYTQENSQEVTETNNNNAKNLGEVS